MTMPDTTDTDAARHLTTREGWHAFTSQRPSPPALLSENEYAGLCGAELDRYDEDRLDHHARLLVMATSTVRHPVTSGRRLVLLNRHAVGARRGLIIFGPAGTWKTIAITQLGLVHELQDRARHPNTRGAYGQVRLTCSGSCRARRAYWRKKEKLTLSV